jgi:hypothetical protein
MFLPDVPHVPLNEQPVAAFEDELDTDHVMVALLPLVIVLGLAVIVYTGRFGSTTTDAVASCAPAVPELLQVSLKSYCFIELSGPTTCEPLALLLPVQSPLATHDVGLLATCHVNVTDEPGRTESATLLEIVTQAASGGGSLTVTLTVAVLDDPALFLQIIL